MKKVSTVILAFAALTAASGALADGDAAAGKSKAGVCAACHGTSGTSVQSIWPNLAAQKVGYMVKQLKAFRDGSRADPVMEPIAKGLSDQDINNLAAYFSQQAASATQASAQSAPKGAATPDAPPN